MSVFMSGRDYLALPRPKESWVVEDLIPVGGSALLMGQAKAGKSFGALGIGFAVSNNEPEWLGFRVLTPGPVAYLQVDTAPTIWTRYLTRCEDAGHDASNMYFADMDLAPAPFDMLDPHHQRWLKHQLDQIQPVLVVVDAWRELHSGDENDSGQSKIVFSALKECCKPAALLIIHHAKKENPQFGVDIMSAGRGSNYMNGKVDFLIHLTKKHLTTEGRSERVGKKDIKRAKCGLLILDELKAAELKIIRQILETMPLDNEAITMKARQEAYIEARRHEGLLTPKGKDISMKTAYNHIVKFGKRLELEMEQEEL